VPARGERGQSENSQDSEQDAHPRCHPDGEAGGTSSAIVLHPAVAQLRRGRGRAITPAVPAIPASARASSSSWSAAVVRVREVALASKLPSPACTPPTGTWPTCAPVGVAVSWVCDWGVEPIVVSVPVDVPIGVVDPWTSRPLMVWLPVELCTTNETGIPVIRVGVGRVPFGVPVVVDGVPVRPVGVMPPVVIGPTGVFPAGVVPEGVVVGGVVVGGVVVGGVVVGGVVVGGVVVGGVVVGGVVVGGVVVGGVVVGGVVVGGVVVGGKVGVPLPPVPRAHCPGLVIVSVFRVTAPACDACAPASSRPVIVALLLTEMSSCARTVPSSVELVPSVAALPTR